MTSLNDYKNYFKSLAAANGLDFVYGGSERILNRQNMDITYPCLWVGVPEIRRTSSGGAKKIFDGWFIVLTDAPADDIAAQDDGLDAMEALTETLLGKMTDDHFARVFEFDPDEAVSFFRGRQTADDAWGWFTEFKLTGLQRC